MNLYPNAPGFQPAFPLESLPETPPESQRDVSQSPGARAATAAGADALSFRTVLAAPSVRARGHHEKASTMNDAAKTFYSVGQSADQAPRARESAFRPVVHEHLPERDGVTPSAIAFPGRPVGVATAILNLPNLSASAKDGRWIVIPKEGQISMIECLLKAAICDGKGPEEARKILAEKPILDPLDNGYFDTCDYLLDNQAEPTGIKRYGSCEMLEKGNGNAWAETWIGKSVKERDAFEKYLAETIAQALKSKFDHVLFVDCSFGTKDRTRLIHAVDIDKGVASFRELPSKRYETAPVFPLYDSLDNCSGFWAFLGFRKRRD